MNKYREIIEILRNELSSGAIKPGQKLPSLRELAASFGCGKNTAIRAYTELEREQFIYAVPKSGYYAVNRPPQRSNVPPVLIDFASAAPDPDVMPVAAFQQCLNQAIALYQDRLFSYSDPQGFPSLREALARHLASAQVFAPARSICVVSGAQQALHLLAGMPLPGDGQAVLIEQPAFAGMIRTLQLLNVEAVGINRTAEGFNLQELEAYFQSGRFKFFYTVPRFHNPMGYSLPKLQKQEIAGLAGRYGVYVVEDDFLADLETDRKADPIYSYDRTGHVIYVKSFSKVMLPGLRLAAAVIPDSLLGAFRNYKSSCDSSTAALSQAALELYLESGLFDRHTALMKERYALRMAAMRTAAEAVMGDAFPLTAPAGGLFAHLSLPGETDPMLLAGKLQERGVAVMPTNGCYLPGTPHPNGIRLSVIRTDEEQIAQGLPIIREEIEMMLGSRRKLLAAAVHWI